MSKRVLFICELALMFLLSSCKTSSPSQEVTPADIPLPQIERGSLLTPLSAVSSSAVSPTPTASTSQAVVIVDNSKSVSHYLDTPNNTSIPSVSNKMYNDFITDVVRYAWEIDSDGGHDAWQWLVPPTPAKNPVVTPQVPPVPSPPIPQKGDNDIADVSYSVLEGRGLFDSENYKCTETPLTSAFQTFANEHLKDTAESFGHDSPDSLYILCTDLGIHNDELDQNGYPDALSREFAKWINRGYTMGILGVKLDYYGSISALPNLKFDDNGSFLKVDSQSKYLEAAQINNDNAIKKPYYLLMLGGHDRIQSFMDAQTGSFKQKYPDAAMETYLIDPNPEIPEWVDNVRIYTDPDFVADGRAMQISNVRNALFLTGDDPSVSTVQKEQIKKYEDVPVALFRSDTIRDKAIDVVSMADKAVEQTWIEIVLPPLPEKDDQLSTPAPPEISSDLPTSASPHALLQDTQQISISLFPAQTPSPPSPSDSFSPSSSSNDPSLPSDADFLLFDEADSKSNKTDRLRYKIKSLDRSGDKTLLYQIDIPVRGRNLALPQWITTSGWSLNFKNYAKEVYGWEETSEKQNPESSSVTNGKTTYTLWGQTPYLQDLFAGIAAELEGTCRASFGIAVRQSYSEYLQVKDHKSYAFTRYKNTYFDTGDFALPYETSTSPPPTPTASGVTSDPSPSE